ncbi:MAG: NitT/TauT family transport system substrate-binding protein, partial [Variibacter sp.]|nr:NitT/TauT family transport system substrate-binding protein [Variibacter sp.]
HGLSAPDPTPYTAVSTYYNDFVAGHYDVCIGSWDTFAARYLAGVPIKLLCGITTAEMIAVLAPKNGAADIPQLKGKIFAGLPSTGTYRMVKAIIQETYGIDLEKEMTVQGVDNPAASVTLLMADRADAALSWEPNITTGLQKKPDLRIIFNAGEAYRKIANAPLPYFAVAVRNDRLAKSAGYAAKLSKMFEECLSGINANPAEAVDLFGSRTGIPPDVMKTAMQSGRLKFTYQPMADAQARESVVKASEFLARNGLLPRKVDDGFFAA